MARLSRGFLVLMVIFVFFSAAAAPHEGGRDLVLAGAAPEAGKAFWVGFRPPLPPGTLYTTFWPEGFEGPEMAWDLPAGFATRRPGWPEFQNFAAEGPPRFGFAPDSIIWQEIVVPQDWDGGPFQIGLRMAYQACDPDCRPVTETAHLDYLPGQGGFEPFNPPAYTLGPLAVHADAGAGGDFLIGVNFRFEDNTPRVKAAYFLPGGPGLLPGGPPLRLEPSKPAFYSQAFRGYLGKTPLSPGAEEWPAIPGVVVFEMADGSGFQAAPVFPRNDYRAIAALEPVPEVPAGPEMTLLTAFVFALLGGLILNVMPCVLPVLALKVFAFLKSGAKSRPAMRADGLAYTLGIVLSFAAVGGILLALKAGGRAAGWGYQMQSPGFVLAMAVLIFAIGLNFLGAFQISAGRLAGLGQGLSEKGGPAGAFFTGVLASVVATPCTAPFMAAALAFGLAADPATAFLVFAGLGIGLALPYLALSFVPALGKVLPKPGPWMTTFKKLLAVPLFATVAWLVWILSVQAGSQGLLAALFSLSVLGLAVWLGRVLKTGAFKTGLVAVLAAAALSPLFLGNRALPSVAPSQEARWESVELIPYSAPELARLRAEGRPVFLHFWAAWCPVCILHEELVFKTGGFADFVAREDIAFVYIDNTVTSPEIWELIQSFGRQGQPIDVFYAPGAEAVVLPEVYTKDYLLGRLARELAAAKP